MAWQQTINAVSVTDAFSQLSALPAGYTIPQDAIDWCTRALSRLQQNGLDGGPGNWTKLTITMSGSETDSDFTQNFTSQSRSLAVTTQ